MSLMMKVWIFTCSLLGLPTIAAFVSLQQKPFLTTTSTTSHPKTTTTTRLFVALGESSSFNDIDKTTRPPQTLVDLHVAIAGGGPSGLLLAHKLLAAGATVRLFEARSKPMLSSVQQSQSSRAYALGIGTRGRMALQSVPQVWETVKEQGYGSERFQLHVGPFTVRLREGGGTEPSLLLFQSDLCAALWLELERQWMTDSQEQQRLQVHFDAKVTNIDFQQKILQTTSKMDDTVQTFQFDLVVGCDGVNSVVRQAMAHDWQAFETSNQTLPGQFKAVRLNQMPPKLDPTAVALIVPQKGSVTAFVEPTAQGTCCILFAGRDPSNPILSSQNVDEIETCLTDSFSSWLQGADLPLAAQQLAAQRQASSAQTVTCNCYHYRDVAVLCGDAAHATGGVSGQGVNSALQDVVVLANQLVGQYKGTTASLQQALLTYSQNQVPQGKALYDLSFPPTPQSGWGRLKQTLILIRDTLFQVLGVGEPPIQTILTTTTKSFADIRRDRQKRYYHDEFPDQATWNITLAALDATASCTEPQQSQPT